MREAEAGAPREAEGVGRPRVAEAVGTSRSALCREAGSGRGSVRSAVPVVQVAGAVASQGWVVGSLYRANQAALGVAVASSPARFCLIRRVDAPQHTSKRGSRSLLRRVRRRGMNRVVHLVGIHNPRRLAAGAGK